MFRWPQALWLQILLALCGGLILGACGSVIAMRASLEYWARAYPHDGQASLGVVAVGIFSFAPLLVLFAVAIFIGQLFRKPQIMLFAGLLIVGFACWQGLVLSQLLRHWSLVAFFGVVCCLCLVGAIQTLARPFLRKYSKIHGRVPDLPLSVIPSGAGISDSLKGPEYPDAIDPSKVGSYSPLAKAGGGYVWDEVLEYRVWLHPERGAVDEQDGSDYYYAFATYKEALKFSETSPGAEPPLALIRQAEYIDESETNVYRHMKEERIAEWPVEFLKRPRRTAKTIPDFLAPDAPENRLDIIRAWQNRAHENARPLLRINQDLVVRQGARQV